MPKPRHIIVLQYYRLLWAGGKLKKLISKARSNEFFQHAHI